MSSLLDLTDQNSPSVPFILTSLTDTSLKSTQPYSVPTELTLLSCSSKKKFPYRTTFGTISFQLDFEPEVSPFQYRRSCQSLVNIKVHCHYS